MCQALKGRVNNYCGLTPGGKRRSRGRTASHRGAKPRRVEPHERSRDETSSAGCGGSKASRGHQTLRAQHNQWVGIPLELCGSPQTPKRWRGKKPREEWVMNKPGFGQGRASTTVWRWVYSAGERKPVRGFPSGLIAVGKGSWRKYPKVGEPASPRASPVTNDKGGTC